MLAKAAQVIDYIYPADQDRASAFNWWLSPCGGTDLVPEEIQQVFDFLSGLTDYTNFKPPTNIPKGSGRKGDSGNPHDQSIPRASGGGGSGGTSGGGSSSSGSNTKPTCEIKRGMETKRVGNAKNTLRVEECVKDVTKTSEYVITSFVSAQQAQPTLIERECQKKWVDTGLLPLQLGHSSQPAVVHPDMRSRGRHD